MSLGRRKIDNAVFGIFFDWLPQTCYRIPELSAVRSGSMPLRALFQRWQLKCLYHAQTPRTPEMARYRRKSGQAARAPPRDAAPPRRMSDIGFSRAPATLTAADAIEWPPSNDAQSKSSRIAYHYACQVEDNTTPPLDDIDAAFISTLYSESFSFKNGLRAIIFAFSGPCISFSTFSARHIILDDVCRRVISLFYHSSVAG